jgi:hypothetical protein
MSTTEDYFIATYTYIKHRYQICPNSRGELIDSQIGTFYPLDVSVLIARNLNTLAWLEWG